MSDDWKPGDLALCVAVRSRRREPGPERGSPVSFWHRLFTKPPTELETWWSDREASFAARRAARESGQTYVSGHVRRAR